jgi:hypothetical protein
MCIFGTSRTVASKPERPAGTGDKMPRYLVERSFPDGLDIPINDNGRTTVASVISTNADLGVNWVHSYVGDDSRKTFCIYDAATPEAIRKVAQRNGLPVDAITEVRVLDPYFYTGKGGGSDAS